MDCALQYEWMRQIESVEMEADLMEFCVWLWMVVLFIICAGWLLHSFHACVTPPASSGEVGDLK